MTLGQAMVQLLLQNTKSIRSDDIVQIFHRKIQSLGIKSVIFKGLNHFRVDLSAQWEMHDASCLFCILAI